MISAFETSVRLHPQKTCLLFVDDDGSEAAYSYREVRMISAALAKLLRSRGAQPSGCVAVDLPNSPAYVLLALAAAYGGFPLVALNHRLTPTEKAGRLREVDGRHGLKVALRVDEGNVDALIADAQALLDGSQAVLGTDSASRTSRAATERSARSGVRPRREPARKERARTLFGGRLTAMDASPRTTRASGRPDTTAAAARRQDENARQDAVEGVIHFAEHAASLFDPGTTAFVMFTSGTTGHPKAVALSWENILSSATVANAALGSANRSASGSSAGDTSSGDIVWQGALPLFHIGGFQVLVRSILSDSLLALYGSFDARRLLSHGQRIGATHVSVVDKMLQDMLAVGSRESLARYRCVLLGGGPLNPSTVSRACTASMRVYASYGMTETSSLIACAPVTPSFAGGLRMLDGYEAQIVDPDNQGVGRLAVKGPGVFAGYLNARAAFTVDGFFLTGDSAAIVGGRLYVKERTRDMFVSGGENVYPAEICQKLLQFPQVSDAYVFGAHDARWGRRPVAFLERDRLQRRAAEAAGAPAHAETNHALGLGVQASLQGTLSKLYQPKHLFVVDTFPRNGVGKINRAALEERYQRRIQVKKVVLYRVRLPFKRPFQTPKETLRHRELIIVEVTDHAGRTGLGECAAFTTDWYLPEILDTDERVLRELLAPLVLRTPMLHPSEADGVFATYPELESYPLARAAIEQALWDLYGKVCQKPLWELLGGGTQGIARLAPEGSLVEGGAAGSQTLLAPAGVVIGVGPVGETVAMARQCAEAGYERLKLKVVPGTAFAVTSAVREALPDIMLSLDANQGYTERSCDELVSLDALDLAWIEEPLASQDPSATPGMDLFARLARLQQSLRTPLCLDESIVTPRDLARALEFPNLRCYAVKAAKFGGVEPTLQLMQLAKARSLKVWMSGLFETGIGRRFSAAFESLLVVSAPGDIGATSRYFGMDITVPHYEAQKGSVALNPASHPYGIGCELNRDVLQSVLVSRTVVR